MTYSVVCRTFIISSVLLFMLFGCTEQKTSPESKEDSYTDLVRLLGNDISRTTKSGVTVIEYCPDNTCESFSIASGKPQEKLGDFVYLYLYFVSDYHVLDDFRKKVDPTQVSEIIQHNIREYDRGNQINSAKAVMEMLVYKYSIKANFVRYDELKKNEVAIDIKSHLEELK